MNETLTIFPHSATHLQDQCYSFCFRREQGKCAICYNVVDEGGSDDVNDQGSFGLRLRELVQLVKLRAKPQKLADILSDE